MSLTTLPDILWSGVIGSVWFGYLIVTYAGIVVLTGLYMRQLVLSGSLRTSSEWTEDATGIYRWFSWEIVWYTDRYRIEITPVHVFPFTCRITTYEHVDEGFLGRHIVEQSRPLFPRAAYAHVSTLLENYRASKIS